MAAISDNLIHFLGRQFKDSPNKQFEVFQKIIENGLMCSKVNVKFSGGGTVYNNAVCFTDIPLSECDEHAANYGKYGIGFKKSFVKNKGGNPARYFINYVPSQIDDGSMVENRGLLYANLSIHFEFVKMVGEKLKTEEEFSIYDKNGNIIISNQKLKEWYELQITLLSYDKETGDLGPARDETKEIDLYYKEREWRLVPTQLNMLSNTVIIDQSSQKAYYSFTRDDINVVVTPNDEIRSNVLRYFFSLAESKDKRLRDFAENPVPIITYDDLKKW